MAPPTSTSPSIVPRTDLIICSPIRSPAGPNRRLLARRLGGDLVLAPQHEEEGEKREKKNHDLVKRDAADRTRLSDDAGIAQMTELPLRGFGSAEVNSPPGIDPPVRKGKEAIQAGSGTP